MSRYNDESRSTDGDVQEQSDGGSTERSEPKGVGGIRAAADASHEPTTRDGNRAELTRQLGTNDAACEDRNAKAVDGSNPSDSLSSTVAADALPPPVPDLLTYMTTTSGPERDAMFLRTYAARVRDGSAVDWEIPNTVASTLEGIANRLVAPPAVPEPSDRPHTESDLKGVMPTEMHVRPEHHGLLSSASEYPAVDGEQHPSDNTATGEPSDRLRALIEQWRKSAVDRGYEAYSQIAFGKCADDLEEALRSAVPRLRPSLDWQPIASAPKDGSWFWVRRDKLTAPNQIEVSAFRWDEKNKSSCGWFSGTGWWHQFPMAFTHWAPMPVPPLPAPQEPPEK